MLNSGNPFLLKKDCSVKPDPKGGMPKNQKKNLRFLVSIGPCSRCGRAPR